MALLPVKDALFGDFRSPGDFTAAAASDTFYDDGLQRTFYVIKNESGSNVTVTFTKVETAVPVSGRGSLTVPDRTKQVTTGNVMIMGPFPPQFINSDGLVTVTLTGTASVTVAVIKLTPG